jgi:hypothetical protein
VGAIFHYLQDGKHFGLQTTNHYYLRTPILPEEVNNAKETEWKIQDYFVDPNHCVLTAIIEQK